MLARTPTGLILLVIDPVGSARRMGRIYYLFFLFARGLVNLPPGTHGRPILGPSASNDALRKPLSPFWDPKPLFSPSDADFPAKSKTSSKLLLDENVD